MNEVNADFDEDGLKINSSLYKVSEEQEKRIKSIERETREKLGWNLGRCEHKYFIVDKFYETDYKKTSIGGIQGHRYSNLKDVLEVDKLPPLEEISKELRKKEWK